MKKSKFFVDFSWIVFFIFLFIFLKICVVGIYLVPSPSMLPELIPGDRIIANKLAYGLAIPFIQTPFFQWSTPQRGEVILFSFPNKSEIYIKRVIGLPGDLISFKNGAVYINGDELKLQTVSHVYLTEGDLTPYLENNSRLFKKSHDIYLSKEPSQTFFETRRFLVPPGKLFVLGDNRDNSTDSRAYGYVDFKNVYGRASFVLFSTTGKGFLPKFRSERTILNISH